MGNCSSIRNGGSEQPISKASKVDLIFEALDDDHNGILTRDEIVDWILDERFVENKLYVDIDISDILKELMGVLDVNQDKSIEKSEMAAYLEAIPEATIDEMFSTVLHTRVTREKAFRRVYNAMDRDHSGKVDKAEVLYWLQNERAWQDLGTLINRKEKHAQLNSQTSVISGVSNNKKQQIYAFIDKNMDGEISMEEMKSFLQDWTIRDLREFTEDQTFAMEFEKYRKEKTPESYEKLRLLKRDQQYVEKMAALRADRVKSKRDKLAQSIMDSLAHRK